jgi:hypothetical protein
MHKEVGFTDQTFIARVCVCVCVCVWGGGGWQREKQVLLS